MRRISRGRLGRIRVELSEPRVRKKQFRYAFLMNVTSSCIPKQIKEMFEIMDDMMSVKQRRDKEIGDEKFHVPRSRDERHFYDLWDIYFEGPKETPSPSTDRSCNFYCIQDQKRVIASQLRYLLAASPTRKLDESPGRIWSRR